MNRRLVIFIVILMGSFLLSCENNIKQNEFKPNQVIYPDTLSLESSLVKVLNKKYKKVDKHILLGKFDYRKDTNFIKVDRKFCSKTIYLRKEVLLKFEEMYNAALEEGVELKIISGTRNFNQQKSIWERKWTANIKTMDSLSSVKEILKYSSMPCTSRHHWGTDIDLNDLNNSYFEYGKGEKVFTWLTENAHKYGFHMTYDDQTTSNRTGYKLEKWHWSYMPIANVLLKQYKEEVSCRDIEGFKAANFACHEEIDMVTNYVLGINMNFKIKE